jgi:hypothetical protein
MPTANVQQNIQTLQSVSVDDRLAVLWYLYEAIKGQLSPGDSDTAGFDVAQGLVDEIRAMPHEKQLQVQRDIAGKANTQESVTYSSYSSSGQLFFWYLLAQGIENGSIVPVPEDYQLSSEAQSLLGEVKNYDFEQQIDFARSAVSQMGA